MVINHEYSNIKELYERGKRKFVDTNLVGINISDCCFNQVNLSKSNWIY